MVDYPKAAACSGAIFYLWDGSSPSMTVGLTDRSDAAGAGYGISGGGFSEIGAFLKHDIGTIASLKTEAYRELGEELFGEEDGPRLLEGYVSSKDFDAYAQPLDGFLIRTGDVNKVHAPVYYGYPVTIRESMALADLPDTEERTGQIAWSQLSWKPGMTRENLMADVSFTRDGEPVGLEAFFHKHELPCVFHELAWLASRGRLWNDRAA